MYLYKLFPTLGKLIASTGTPSFPRTLHNLITSGLAVDATHMVDLRFSAPDTSQPRVTSFGVIGSGPTCNESILRTLSLKTPTSLIVNTSDTACRAQEMFFCQRTLRPNEQPNHLHLFGKVKGRCVVVSVYRSGNSQGFSPLENAFFKKLFQVLLPVIGNHLMVALPISAAQAQQNGSEALLKRFNKRLKLSGKELSPREFEICFGHLSGETVTELAKKLNLRASTVNSYLKRAAIKLEIGGRHALSRWLYSIDLDQYP